jgi:curved DNA-binding protein CbpA
MTTNRPEDIRNPFEILGIAPESDHRTIKKAYRRLAKKFHPDVNPDDPESEKRFKQIQWAYDALLTANQWMTGGLAVAAVGAFA